METRTPEPRSRSPFLLEPLPLSDRHWAAINRLRLARGFLRRQWYRPAQSPDGMGYCLIVALQFAGPVVMVGDDPARGAIEQVCRERLERLGSPVTPGGSATMTYNDHPAVTLPDVLSALEEAEELIVGGEL